jgi:uncharacterized membrane protein
MSTVVAPADSTGMLASPAPRVGRVASVDILRGAVMVLMAIDHVRVFSGQPAGGPTPGIFFTRWITHFCAPAFVFLAGASAFYYGRSHRDLARFLVTRGAWLVLLELSVIRLSWTFNLDFAHYEMGGVIWAIGWCMILLAVLTRLPIGVIGVLGGVIIAGHNLAAPIVPAMAASRWSPVWKVLYLGFVGGPIHFGPDGPNLIVLYSIIPWVGVMAAGFAFGSVLAGEPLRRDRLCLRLGITAISLFLLLRGLDLYGDPRPWRAGMLPSSGMPPMPAVLAFLNTTKYPASLSFLLMTLGPTIALIPLLEHWRGRVGGWLEAFGRVPFFYYVLHIPLIHGLAILVSLLREGGVNPWLFANHPMGNPPPPDGYVWSLPLVYAIWVAAVLILYPACRWFGALKSRRRDWWLRYL